MTKRIIVTLDDKTAGTVLALLAAEKVLSLTFEDVPEPEHKAPPKRIITPPHHRADKKRAIDIVAERWPQGQTFTLDAAMKLLKDAGFSTATASPTLNRLCHGDSPQLMRNVDHGVITFSVLRPWSV